MKIGVILLNFGEPEDPTLENVVAFLERIFYANCNLEGAADERTKRERSRELAERRAPGLIDEYSKIGSSPMNDQAAAQARRLSIELQQRQPRATVYSGFQFTPPLVHDAVAMARDDQIERLVALPVYPICGPSTNVAAVQLVQTAIDELGWRVELRSITGWHRHPLYMELRADAIRVLARDRGLDLSDRDTRIVFSAHGTPQKYVDEGSRYVAYVEEYCDDISRRLSLPGYEIGYQNHSNRGIEWTAPDVDEVIRSVGAKRVVVDPVSFMHEQSETLVELDHELAEVAVVAGTEFHRVPVPHDDPRFAKVLADLVQEVSNGSTASGIRLGQCRCYLQEGTYCLNSLPRALPTGQ
jgi:ferrochelatase